MKVCCVIDSLNSGGAQRQMTWLVRILAERGHDVRLLMYHDYRHFSPEVERYGVSPDVIPFRIAV